MSSRSTSTVIHKPQRPVLSLSPSPQPWAASVAETTAKGSFMKWFVAEETWRAMFGSELVPRVFFFVMAAFLSESPRWLIKEGRVEQAGQVQNRIFRNSEERELVCIQETVGRALEAVEADFLLRELDCVEGATAAGIPPKHTTARYGNHALPCQQSGHSCQRRFELPGEPHHAKDS